MPIEFLQPFDFFFRREERHAIAFLAGHPTYEAVEAFASESMGIPVVQAVLTRHDQRQIDYVSDADARAARRTARQPSTREVHVGPVSFAADGGPDGVHLGIHFVAADGMAVVLDVHTVGPALPDLGGLTDPLGHAPDVLPIMYREASTLGGPGTMLQLGGVPSKLTAAYYTEGFAIGVLSAGVLEDRPTGRPDAIRVGARWTSTSAGGEAVYEIAARDGDRLLIERRGGRAERVTARVVGGRVHLEELRVASATAVPGELVLSFVPFLPVPPAIDAHAEAGRFTIAIDSHRDLIRGRVLPAAAGFTLLPEAPAWAARRAFAVTVADADGMRRVTTRVVAH